MFVSLGMIDFLNSREDAALFWVVLAAMVALWKVPDIRPQAVLVIRSFLSPKLLLGIWIPASIYATIVVYLAAAAGLWHTSSTKETVYWFAGTALVLAGGATQANDSVKFRKLFRRVLKVTIFIEFLVNLFVFPLAVELMLIPLLVLFGGMQAVAEGDPKLAPARNVIGFVLSVAGLVIVVHAVASAVGDPVGLLTWEHLEEFLVPPVLTVVFVPFLFYVALRSTYELVFVRVSILVKDERLARRAKWAIVGACGLSLGRIGRFNGRFFSMLHEIRDDSDVRALANAFQAELAAPAEGRLE
jgi:hypothetical protein